MLVDLNIPWPQVSYQSKPSLQEIERLKCTLSTLHCLGYTHIALNFTINHSDKFPKNTNELNPIDLTLFKDLITATNLKLYTRITLIIDDPSKGQSLSKISQEFDIIAAMPISEKGLTLATTNLDIDLLTFQYNQRLPAILKHKSICSCVNRGIKIEIVYGFILRDPQSRRQFIINARNVIRSTRSRGIVISSGANNSLECRNVKGVTSIIKFLGLQSDKCGKAMGELASLVLLNGRLRGKSYKQTIVVGGGKDSNIVNEISEIDTNRTIKIIKRKYRDEDDHDIPSQNKNPKISA